MPSEIVSTAITDFIGVGLSRVLGRLSTELRIRKRIDAILSGATLEPSLIDKTNATSSFERVLGNATGKLNNRLSAILNRMTADGFANSVMAFSIAQRTDFSDLHKIMLTRYGDDLRDLPIPSDILLRCLIEISTSVFYDQFSDAKHVSFITAQITQVSERLDQALSRMADARANLISPDTFLEVGNKLALSINSANRDISIETNRGRKRVSIEKLHIPDRLNQNPSDIFIRKKRGGIEREIARGHFVDFPGRSEHVRLFDILSIHDRIVVLGNPGGGKSTLCQYICFQMSKTYALRHKYPERSQINSVLSKVPIKLVLRDFESEHEVNRTSIFEYASQ